MQYHSDILTPYHRHAVCIIFNSVNILYETLFMTLLKAFTDAYPKDTLIVYSRRLR